MTTHAPLAIEATALEKSFGETHAVAGVDLTVPDGTIYGVLGPNGAGKTTVIRMLATLLPPDAGSARVLGHDIRTEGDAVRSLVSLTGQLKASVGTGGLHERLLAPERRPEAAAILERAVGTDVLEPDPAALSVSCADPARAADGVAAVSRSGLGIAEFSLGQPSLDEVFLALTGHLAEERDTTLEEQSS